jgi:restriction system protein
MPIPKYHEIMLPLLEAYKDGNIHHRKEFTDQLADLYNLSEDERSVVIRSGHHTRFWDRIHWALTFLKKSWLLISPKRGYYQITQRGIDVLQMKLTELNAEKIKELFPDIMETPFWNPALRDRKDNNEETSLNEQTPDETLDFILREKESFVKGELTEQIKSISPRSFEFLVTKLLIAMWYGTEEFSITTNYTNDNGIDWIIQSDELGFEKIFVQAKKYEWSVGRPDMQKFVWAMTGTSKGVFITTSDFSSWVLEYLKSRPEKVILINGEKLVDLMYRYNQGVSVRSTIEVKWIDGDYFEELE